MKKMALLPYDRYQRLLLRDQPPEAEKDTLMTLQTEKPLDTNESSTQSIPEEGKDRETLISIFPKSMQNRVRSVLEYIGPNVTWNDKGEVSIQDQDIPGSNIVDLLKVHLKDCKDFNPVGKDAFRMLLCELNVPMSLLASSARQQSGRGYLPPPPVFHPNVQKKPQTRKKSNGFAFEVRRLLIQHLLRSEKCRGLRRSGEIVQSREKGRKVRFRKIQNS